MQCTRSSWGCTQPCLVYLIVGTRLVYIHLVCNEAKAVQVPHISWVQVSAKTETVCVCECLNSAHLLPWVRGEEEGR